MKYALQQVDDYYQRKQIEGEPCESDNEDICYVCGGSGSLILCDSCPRSVHLECEGLTSVSETDNFYCKDCRRRGYDVVKVRQHPYNNSISNISSNNNTSGGQKQHHNNKSSSAKRYNAELELSYKEYILRKMKEGDPLAHSLENILKRDYWKTMVTSKQEFDSFAEALKESIQLKVFYLLYKQSSDVDYNLIICQSKVDKIDADTIAKLLQNDHATFKSLVSLIYIFIYLFINVC